MGLLPQHLKAIAARLWETFAVGCRPDSCCAAAMWRMWSVCWWLVSLKGLFTIFRAGNAKALNPLRG